MRYRQESSTGDYLFGQGDANFLINTPATVAQAVKTGLLLFLGEYFADTTVGMPWDTDVFGFNTASIYDAAIQQQIEQTEGVRSIVNYSSSLNRVTRTLTINCTIDTIYSGIAVVNIPIPLFGYGIGGISLNPYGA